MTRESKPNKYTIRTSEATERLKIALAIKGHTFASWARINGFSYSSVWTAAAGTRNGAKAIRIRAKLERFAAGALTEAQIAVLMASGAATAAA